MNFIKVFIYFSSTRHLISPYVTATKSLPSPYISIEVPGSVSRYYVSCFLGSFLTLSFLSLNLTLIFPSFPSPHPIPSTTSFSSFISPCPSSPVTHPPLKLIHTLKTPFHLLSPIPASSPHPHPQNTTHILSLP